MAKINEFLKTKFDFYWNKKNGKQKIYFAFSFENSIKKIFSYQEFSYSRCPNFLKQNYLNFIKNNLIRMKLSNDCLNKKFKSFKLYHLNCILISFLSWIFLYLFTLHNSDLPNAF